MADPGTDTASVPPRQRALEAWFIRVVEGTAAWVARHWLLVVNSALAVFFALPLLAPVLMANGFTSPATFIYGAYRITCHQLPHRSFFIAGPQRTYSEDEIEALTGIRPLAEYVGAPEVGYKMAWCEREVGIYGAMLLAGLLYGLVRRRLPLLPFWVYLLFLVPLAVDGTIQLFGWRESTWYVRMVTGGLFGLATVWLVYPYLDEAMRVLALDLGGRQSLPPR